jgi:hypothetical protein
MSTGEEIIFLKKAENPTKLLNVYFQVFSQTFFVNPESPAQ